MCVSLDEISNPMWMETVKFAHVISTRKADKHRVCLLCPVYSRRAIIRGQRGNHSIKHSGGWNPVYIRNSLPRVVGYH